MDITEIGITEAALETIVAHARSERPRECCGLLLGAAQTILKAVPIENVAADPFRQYEISPAAYLAEIRRCREQGEIEIVGAYHSHPRSAAEPSPTDLSMAFAEFLFLIAGPVSDEGPVDVRAWILRGDAFEPVTLSRI
jgi:desampylase